MEKKVRVGKWLIFISGMISAIIAIYTEMISPESFTDNDLNSPFMIILGLILSAIFIYGLYLGSRAVGIPLTVQRFFQLIFGFPCWIPFAIYICALILVNTL